MAGAWEYEDAKKRGPRIIPAQAILVPEEWNPDFVPGPEIFTRVPGRNFNWFLIFSLEYSASFCLIYRLKKIVKGSACCRFRQPIAFAG